VHDLLDREPVISALRERWGEEIESGGVVDRTAVGRRVFTDPAELEWLEQQVHPLVQNEIAEWFSALPPDCHVAAVEVPLLFEGEMADRFDVTVAVVADESLRRARAESRGQAGLEGRERRQLSQGEKAGRADRVIRNDGTIADLEAALGQMLAELGTELPTDRPV
jgi:dephospho-CoA kinase